MTINKSQGQTLQKVGIFLQNPVFAHGQLYVAISRCANPSEIKFFVPFSEEQNEFHQVNADGSLTTINEVWPECLLSESFL